MSERTYLDFLADILDCLEQAQAFIQGMTFDDFSADRKTRFAVTQALEIVGEATKAVAISSQGSSSASTLARHGWDA
jgi:uncharacterized protein with HEPN domain